MNAWQARHGIVTASSPRLTTTESSDGKTRPVPGAVSFDCFQSILGTARQKTTATKGAKESRFERREKPAIGLQAHNKNPLKKFHLRC